jgi:predicted SAM-dependent methyltransferase
MLKLNLGCGIQKISDFVNIDLHEGADLQYDLRFGLPYDDKSVDEIMAIHVIESFYAWEFPDIIKGWYRVLKDNGKLTIEFTSLSDTISMYLSGNRYGAWGLYGDQSKPVDPIVVHHYVYEKDELESILTNVGFKNIIFTLEGVQHVPVRDWRAICYH